MRPRMSMLATGVCAWLLLLIAAGAVAEPARASTEAPPPTVADIVARNAAARGGSDAWQKMQTMVWAGHTESTNAPERKLPFLLELKRPDRARFEIVAGGGKMVRIYDGTNGWKLRPDGSGMPQMEPYSADELAFARGSQIIDGPLMSFAAKGAVLALVGTAAIDGRKAYVLNATLPSGDGGRIWVDVETYLEQRLDREVQLSAGKTATSTIVYRDYRSFQGLQIPTRIETGQGPGRAVDKLVVEKVALNPGIDDATFAKPQFGPRRHRGVTVDTRSAAQAAGPPAPSQPPP